MSEDQQTAPGVAHSPNEESSGAGSAPAAVVGIAGSAGALDGFERFFLGLPPGSGCAFVVVAHLNPSGESLLPGLLRRCTTLPVVPAEDGMPLRPDHVYVIPPGKSLAVMNGALLLGEPDGEQGHTIDAFLSSLAADQAERAVAVILSGMGSDGTRGAQRIREHAGLVLVQDPATADYPSMPASVIAGEAADRVLPATDLAPQLYRLVTQQDVLDPGDPTATKTNLDLQKILLQVRSRTGHDFSRYKSSTLLRRIDRRMKSHRIETLAQYARFLQQAPEEVDELFEDLTINVTSFFRDPDAFDSLKEQLRAYLQGRRADGEPFRAWVVGCASGEEAYSVAMVLDELRQEHEDPQLNVQVFATDIDQRSIDKARTGHYPAGIEQNLSADRLARYFSASDGGYQVRGQIRDMVVFASHNTFSDPPFGRLDLLSCRNMLIYLDAELQKKILSVFHYALRPDGLLLLGASETTGMDRDHFVPVDSRWKIYRRAAGAPGLLPVANPVGHGRLAPLQGVRLPAERRPARTPGVSQHAQGMLLARFAPPAVVVNEHGDILYVNGRTGRYLELAPGASGTNNVLDMTHDALRYELASAVRRASRENREIRLRDLRFGADEEALVLDVTVSPLETPDEPGAVMIAFQEHPAEPGQEAVAPEQVDQVQALQRELHHARESLQATIEQMVISTEELRSTNEEYQTTIEELKGTNEELMTSKEELQSVNEELITTNAEYQRVIHELAQANDDMKNLLESAGIATLFLGNDLKIKRFTPQVSSVINLISTDAGRHIGDINLKLRYEHFERDVLRVLETLVPLEAEVQAHDGRWYLMRISPYRTQENYIDGVVVAFTNIDTVKALESQLDRSVLYSESLLNAIALPVVVFDDNHKVVSANRALYSLLRTSESQVRGESLYELGSRQFDVPELRERLQDVVLTDQMLENFVIALEVPGLGSRKFKVDAWPVVSRDGQSAVHLLIMENVTPLLERAAREGANFTGYPGDKHDTSDQS